MLIKKLKELRLKVGLSQKDLAKKLNLSTSRYSNYETGRRNPDLDLLVDLASCFSVSVDFLLGLDIKQPIPELNFLEKNLLDNFKLLNSFAQEKIISYTDDLIANKSNLLQKNSSKKQA